MAQPSYIGPAMLSPSQILYLESVLGVDINHLNVADPLESGMEAAAPIPQKTQLLLVKTPQLTAEEKTLLNKILASVKLPEFEHVEDLDSHLIATHTVVFSEAPAVGRVDGVEGGTCWHLPSLRTMLGNSPDVTTLKKQTWTWMQSLVREVGQ